MNWTSVGRNKGLQEAKAYQLIMKEIPSNVNAEDVSGSILGTVGALPLPMMSTIQDFNEDSFYSFAFRPLHITGRLGPVSSFSKIVGLGSSKSFMFLLSSQWSQ